MLAFSTKDEKNAVSLRLLAQILIFFSLVFMGFLVLAPVQRAIYGGMIGIRDDLINRVEAFVGRKIRYSSISPSIFGAFDVRNVRIMGEDEVPVLSISRFRVSYSFLELLWNKPKAIRSVRIDTPHINLRLDRDKDLIELFDILNTGKVDSRQGFAELLPSRLLVRIRNGQCTIVNGGDQYQIDGLNFSAQVIDNQINLDGRWTLGFLADHLIGKGLSAQAAVRINGSASTGLDEGEAVISIPSVNGDTLRMRSLAFGLTLRDNTLSVRKFSDQLPFELSLDYGLESGDIAAHFSCSNFMIRDILDFSDQLPAGKQWLGIAGTGAASFNRDRDGKLRYQIDISGAVPSRETAESPAGILAAAEGAFFEIRASGDEKLAAVESLHVFIPRLDESNGDGFLGDITFKGSIGLDPLAPEGIVSLNDVSFTGKESLDAELSINTRNGEIHVFGETVALGRVDLTALSASLLPSGGDLGFKVSALRFRDIESYDHVRLSSFSLEGSLNSESGRIEASVLLDSFSAADLSDSALPFIKEPLLPDPLHSFWRNISITTEVFFTKDFQHILYNAPRIVIAYEGSRNMVGLVSVSGTDRHFVLAEGRFIQDDDAFLVTGRADFPSIENISFSMNAHYRDLSYFFEGKMLNRRTISVQGSHDLRINISAGKNGAYSGYLQGQNIPIPYRGQTGRLSFFASLRYDSLSFWSLDVDSLELLDIASPAGPALFRIAGRADQDGADIPVLHYRDSLGPLNGNVQVSWPADFSGFSGKLVLGEGREWYRMEGSFLEKHLNLSVSGSGMRLDRMFNSVHNAYADGDIQVSWDSLRSFRAECNLSSLNAKVQDWDLRASARAALDNREFTVYDLALNFAGLEGRIPLFRVQGGEGLAETRAELGGMAGGKKLEGKMALEVSFKPIESWLEIGGAIGSFKGQVSVENLKYADLAAEEPFTIDVSRGGGGLSVSGGPKNMLRVKMDRNGNFYAGLSSPFPIRGSLIGSIDQKTINARCNDLYIDLADLFRLVPGKADVTFAGGYVDASVEIKGSIADPEFFGSARTSSLRIQVPGYVTQDIRPIPFTIAIEGNEMTFGPVPASVGRGAGSVNGWFRFDRWIPNIFKIDINVPHETPIPFGFDITGFLAKGDASGALALSMENLIFDVSGDLFANNTEISLNSEEISQAQGTDMFAQAIIPVTVDIAVSTGPVVEFLWPNANFPVLRATPDMGTKVHVTADSLSRQFSLNSDVKIRSGEIFYFERSFYIRSGSLIFRENELRFEPRLSARAEVRDRTEDGPVTISMIVENAPLLSFTARFESTPSLSQMEIFALLGQNLTGTQVDEDTGTIQRAFLGSFSDMLAQFVVVRQLERQIRNFMRLDMFSVRTQVLQNAFFSATGLMQAPVDRIGVGNYFDNTTVFMGKYFGPDLFTQVMLSMRYDANKTSSGGLSFEPDIGVELQSPLFNIRWDFIPTHPENWWVNDSSVTLTWSRSF
ncbi:MAG: translocation/assembly module TamB [Treponema sp.]|jgi:hypothetical protein|nr:translocation/assembly module TamB [Treponema sp.]